MSGISVVGNFEICITPAESIDQLVEMLKLEKSPSDQNNHYCIPDPCCDIFVDEVEKTADPNRFRTIITDKIRKIKSPPKRKKVITGDHRF